MYEKQDKQGVIEKPRPRVSVRKTEVFKCNTCPFHANTDTHTLNECKTFKKKSVSERKKFLKDHNICYKCCNAVDHNFKSCTFTGRCSECDSDRHPSALHYFQSVSQKDHGRERPSTNNQRPPTFGTDQQVRSSCTKVCGKGFSGKSCSKTVLAKVYPNGQPARARTVYCILDDQSNRTLCRPELFDILCTDSESVGEECYTLVSCSGSFQTSGRTLSGLTVSALDDSFSISLPRVLECVQIPDTHSEIPTPEVTQYHDHLSDIPIPPLRPDVDIVLLIGRDVPDAHHVYEQRLGRPNAPFAQRLGLGWVVVGEVCLDAHKSNVNVMKTYIHSDGRPSLFQPCESKIAVKTTNNDIFIETANDNKQGLSIEDKEFVKMMDLEFCQDETGHWSAPLPFRTLRVRLPNNKAEAYRRAKSLDASLRRNPTKQKHCMEFMRGILDKGHAELAPSLQDEEECWYLPLFGVYHPMKKDKIRIVFDSSSKHDGVSLNSVLMSGPDLTNSLAGILMRFRKEKVAITGDIEQMFYQSTIITEIT
ncbi:uncharacterized protein LOC128552469 [Mercenaria mercenaria]|uniref:uncharacterized protein LOC128552469 n=1 Tax=Mercenaria mercenaria TaxID=6596 RepID=UPI00234F84A2|nr:uncharacterized protein LOC128552469 [Mercenaria mercenaria]